MNEEKKERNPNRKREKETGISSMVGFDTANSSFLTLLIINHKEKTEKGKIKKDLNSEIKKQKRFFVSKVVSSNPSPRLEKFRWPVMITKLRKGQKTLKKFGNCKF